ncbi:MULTISPECIES: YHYH domain-containing protein [Cupriavidus]|uniref:YHYH domain-containing protein n=1 Tax=Cupriavidus cauae TaxID=2608999 RepID=A0A5M8ABS9_9BURK|nr:MULTISPECIES: YHYH domain-containing protein [Cupriavidus]NOV27818.1 YHYH domain-containing protein [Cupriavidus necator]NSX03299.1 YHYH domain-containing protein [Cupriavidus gilardii]KAA6119556.1 YHYH domain-containing protein [Cupriavidus cauae]NSX14026.1 YHYH domain-containing protein [Cupriavidus taiwanensis]UZN48411.1 YHYH domain-containing protein [Cupriavidus cauae]
MLRSAIVLIFAVLGFASTAAWSHSGGTDRNGCHMDHKTGIRHCH